VIQPLSDRMIESAKSESMAGKSDRVIGVSGAALKSPDHPMTQSPDFSQSPDDPITQSPDSSRSPEDGKPLASSTVDDLEGPWILLKVKALGELIPAAGKSLEEKLDATHMPNEISGYLRHEYGILLSELEVSRYGAWLPHIRRDALKKAEEQAERNVQEAKQRMKRRRK
jgi:hypothetical protein